MLPMPFLKKKFLKRTIVFNKLDIEGLLRLLDSGFTFQRALYLIENETNQMVIQNVEDSLNQGRSINEFLSQYFPDELKDYFESFLNILSLEDALRLTLNLYDYDEKTKNMLMKSIAGPLIMLCSCLIGVELFIALGFPALIDMMKGFNLDLSLLIITQYALKIGIMVVFLALVISTLLFVYFLNPKRIVLGYVILSKLKWTKLIRLFLSTQYAVYFSECSKMTSSTKNTLEMMMKIKKKPLIVFLTFHVEQHLLQGISIEKAMSHIYLDPLLGRFMQIAIHSSSTKEMLTSYIELNREKGFQLATKASKGITVFAYAFIGILIVLVYQVLLLPLSMLGQV